MKCIIFFQWGFSLLLYENFSRLKNVIVKYMKGLFKNEFLANYA